MEQALTRTKPNMQLLTTPAQCSALGTTPDSGIESRQAEQQAQQHMEQTEPQPFDIMAEFLLTAESMDFDLMLMSGESLGTVTIKYHSGPDGNWLSCLHDKVAGLVQKSSRFFELVNGETVLDHQLPIEQLIDNKINVIMCEPTLSQQSDDDDDDSYTELKYVITEAGAIIWQGVTYQPDWAENAGYDFGGFKYADFEDFWFDSSYVYGTGEKLDTDRQDDLPYGTVLEFRVDRGKTSEPDI